MNRNEVLRLVLAFALGVLLTLLLTLRHTQGRYVPFGSGASQILDTRNGQVYGHSLKDGKEAWHVFVQGVGAK